MPLCDAILLYTLFVSIIPLWENYRFGGEYNYPDFFHKSIVTAYTLTTLLTVFLVGGYRLPSKLTDVIKGIVLSTVAIFTIYSMLPVNLRFSRAVVLLGGLSALIIIPLYRILISFTRFEFMINPLSKVKRTVIVGDEEGLINIRNLLKDSEINSFIIGRVSAKQDDLGPDVLGNIAQLKEIIRVNRINEVIFSTRGLTASQIINSMHFLSDSNIKIHIAPSGEKLIIGSKSINHRKDIFTMGNSFFRFRSETDIKDFNK